MDISLCCYVMVIFVNGILCEKNIKSIKLIMIFYFGFGKYVNW